MFKVNNKNTRMTSLTLLTLNKYMLDGKQGNSTKFYRSSSFLWSSTRKVYGELINKIVDKILYSQAYLGRSQANLKVCKIFNDF